MDRPEPPQPQTPPRKPDRYEPSPYISPKLREKLEGPESGEPTGSRWSGITGWILVIVVFGALGGGLWALYQSNLTRDRAKAEAARRAAAADSARVAARADSMRAVADSAAKLVAQTPGAKTGSSSGSAPVAGSAAGARPPAISGAASGGSPKPAATTAPGATAAPRAPSQYGIDVGTYLSEDRARELQSELATSTGLSGKVVSKDEGGTTVYHLVLGSFGSKAAAAAKADELSSKGLITEARVVPIKG